MSDAEARSAASVRRFGYWLATGGDGDLPWGLRAFWKALAWVTVALLIYVQASQPGDMFMHVVLSFLAVVFVLIALFVRLGWD